MSGIKYYIDDLNTRFNNLLFTSNNRNIIGLTFLNIRDGVPYYRTGSDYKDALFNDHYDITLFYIESGSRSAQPYGSTSNLDIVVCANMNKFSGYEEEDIIEEVYEVMKVTPFGTGLESITRGFDALEGFTYPEKIKEAMYPYFVFRFKTKLTGILKQM